MSEQARARIPDSHISAGVEAEQARARIPDSHITAGSEPEQARARIPDSDIAEWSSRFSLLSDTTRLRLLVEMHATPDQTVTQLAAAAQITENAASQSLRALRDQGWVSADKEGRTVRYSVVHDAIVHRILHDILGVEHHHTHSH